MKQTLREAGGAIVYFEAVLARSYPSLADLRHALGPVQVLQADDGVILTLAAFAENS
jgi:hypothetical protein